jgi:hypothetical protein
VRLTRRAQVWNVETGACLRTIEQAGHGLCAVFAPGGRHAVVGTKEGALDILDVGAAAVVETQPAHSSAVRAVPHRPAGAAPSSARGVLPEHARTGAVSCYRKLRVVWLAPGGHQCVVHALSGTTLRLAWSLLHERKVSYPVSKCSG